MGLNKKIWSFATQEEFEFLNPRVNLFGPSTTDLRKHGTKAVFVTLVTGYIAGDALAAIAAERPDYEYACLVRSKEKAEAVEKAYPSARIVYGGLDDSAILEEEAAKADIVLHAADASDHVGAAKAIAAGLVKGHSKDNPGFWLHTSGTGVLCFADSNDNFAGLGRWTDKEYNNLTGIDEVTSLPDHAFHRNVDKIVLEAGTKHRDVLKTVIVCPPTIYGRGPSSTRGAQAYELSKLIIQRGFIPIVGQGKTRWNNVHVEDLSDVYRLLVNKAVAKDLSDEIWGPRGYMFAENGEHVWSDLARLIGKEAAKLGYISDPKENALSKDEALEAAGFQAVSWGLNSRGKADRARKYLGWRPSRPSIEDEVPSILKGEYERLSRR